MDKQRLNNSSSPMTTLESISFALELLLTTLQSQGNSQVVYQFLQANLEKINQDFLGFWNRQVTRVIKDIASVKSEKKIAVARKLYKLSDSTTIVLEQIARSEERISIETLIIFSNLIRDFTLGKREINVEIAISGYKKALKVYNFPASWYEFYMKYLELRIERKLGKQSKDIEDLIKYFLDTKQSFQVHRQKLAEVQMNLGIAYGVRLRGKQFNNLEQAITYLNKAAEFYTSEIFPEKWAKIQQNLADVYSIRISGNRSENWRQTIACLKKALFIYNYTDFPEEWVKIKNKLGIAYLAYIPETKTAKEEEAIKLQKWLQNNLELFDNDTQKVFLSVINSVADIASSRAENLEKAITCFQNALRVRTREASPIEWAETIFNFGKTYYYRIKGERAENLEQTITYLQEALQVITADTFPEEWATIQDSLGVVYRDRIVGEQSENLEQAIAYFQNALQIRDRDSLPVEWAMTQHNLGTAYSLRIQGDTQENLKQAIACFTNALRIYTSSAFPEQWTATKNNLELACQKLMNREQAVDMDITSAANLSTSPVPPNQVSSVPGTKNHRNIAILLKTKVSNFLLLLSVIPVALTLNLAFTFFYKNNQFVGAKQVANLGIRFSVILKKINSSLSNFFLVQWYNNLAYMCMKIGEDSKALSFFIFSNLMINELWGNRDIWNLKSLDNIASLLSKLGGSDTALNISQQLMNIVLENGGEYHPYYAHSLNSLACRYIEIKNYDEAFPLFQKLQEIRSNFGGKKHPDYAFVLQNLASLYERTDNYEDALSLYQQALDILSKIFGERHPRYAVVLYNLACLHMKMGSHERSLSLYKQVLEILREAQGENSEEYLKCQVNLALNSVTTNRVSEALASMEQAVNLSERRTKQLISIAADEQRLLRVQVLKGAIDIFLSIVLHYFSQSHDTVQATFKLILRNKAMGAEASSVQRDVVLRGLYPDLEPMLREVANLRMKIARKCLSGADIEGQGTHDLHLLKLNIQRNLLEVRLAGLIPEMDLERQLQAVDSHAAALKLSEQTEKSALVEFFRFDVFDFQANRSNVTQAKKPRYLAFVLLAEEPDNVQMLDLGEAELIDRAIAKFRASIVGETQAREYETVPMKHIISNGRALRKVVFDPLLEAIGDCKRLFIAPDGDLSKLPFEVLSTDDVLPTDDDRRLIDDYQISYLSTGRDILRFGSKSSGQPTDPIIAADPDFDLSSIGATVPEKMTSPPGRQSRDLDSRDINFSRLTYTETEGKQIAAQLGVKPWLGGEVLESKLKAIRSPRILHLATHGFLLPDQKRDPNEEKFGFSIGDRMGRLAGTGMENPLLRSGLALAGANTWLKNGSLPPDAEDGILTAEDVSGLDLLDTELVVLSACETGLGEVQTGEGVFGLRRAFMLAGAKTLVMSLWKVPDQQTQELMVDFYRRVLEGQPRADALRQAQLAMKAKYSNPYYWGAFICQGNPHAMPSAITHEEPTHA